MNVIFSHSKSVLSRDFQLTYRTAKTALRKVIAGFSPDVMAAMLVYS